MNDVVFSETLLLLLIGKVLLLAQEGTNERDTRTNGKSGKKLAILVAHFIMVVNIIIKMNRLVWVGLVAVVQAEMVEMTHKPVEYKYDFGIMTVP